MVIPLIMVILIGTVEFGLSLADLISVRQGTRDAARNAVVDNYGTVTAADAACTLTGTVTNVESQKIMCNAKEEIDRDQTRVRIKVLFPDAGKTAPPDDNSLQVCTEFLHRSPTGMFAFLLNNTVSNTQVTMRIEQDLTAVDAEEETSLSGSWAWCT